MLWIEKLIEQGYEVYLPFSNNSKYDVLAIKDGVIKRISIKYTSTKQNTATWKIEMRQIYRGNGSIKINKFNSDQFDIIAVYIAPKDKVVLIDATKATKLALYIRD